MSKPRITPVHLCGGSGTRLWPLSRKSYPKQFAPLLGKESLFQASVRRTSQGQGDVDFAPPVVITASDYRFIVTEQMLKVGVDPAAVLIEPDGRNTAPAVLAAALFAAQQDPDAVLLVVPSDHVIPDGDAFCRSMLRGLPAVEAGQLVTFGVTPTRGETGYGWLELAQGTSGTGPHPLTRFVEKPDAATAAHMLAAGHFLWNAGIFLFAARDIIAAFQRCAADLVTPVTQAVKQARPDLGFLRLDGGAWAQVDPISVDYAVMEKADNLAVVPFDGAWSDLGSWDAVAQELDADRNGVVSTGPATAIDCTSTLLRAESDAQAVVGIGLQDIVVVAMPDAVLVADRSRTQDVKLAVEALRARGAKQADTFPRDHRPWGHFETLALADRFQVKRIVVKPGAALSLQSHVHRAEHWIVVSGTARVTVDGVQSLLSENQSVYVPLGAQHRLENPGRVPMVLIEVQTGTYLGEDDIVRYEDIYARAQDGHG